MAKSTLVVKCLNGKGEWNFPYELNASKIGTIAALTLGVVTAHRITTETPYTDTVSTPEGDIHTGIRQRKAVCVFKHTPTTGDPRIHRISLPAPDIGDTGIYADLAQGGKIPITKPGTAPGKDGSELATMYANAMDLTGTFEFLSGLLNVKNTQQ